MEFCDGFRKLLDHLQLDKVRLLCVALKLNDFCPEMSLPDYFTLSKMETIMRFGKSAQERKVRGHLHQAL